jgi:hypothetical protein
VSNAAQDGKCDGRLVIRHGGPNGCGFEFSIFYEARDLMIRIAEFVAKSGRGGHRIFDQRNQEALWSNWIAFTIVLLNLYIYVCIYIITNIDENH